MTCTVEFEGGAFVARGDFVFSNCEFIGGLRLANGPAPTLRDAWAHIQDVVRSGFNPPLTRSEVRCLVAGVKAGDVVFLRCKATP